MALVCWSDARLLILVEVLPFQDITRYLSTYKSSIYTIIFQSTKISNIIAILTFGSLVCMSYSFHSSEAMGTPSVMGWVTLGLGLGLGLLFSMFLDKTSDENSDFLAVTRYLSNCCGRQHFFTLLLLLSRFSWVSHFPTRERPLT